MLSHQTKIIYIRDKAIECEDFQTAFSMNRVEYKKQRNYYKYYTKLIYIFIFKITFPKWVSWHAVPSCNCDRKLTITSQRTFITGSNSVPVVLFRP